MRSYSLKFIKRLLPKCRKHASMGFSLLEMAVVMVVLGVLVTPAVQIYHQHRVEKDWNEVESDMTFITNALGSYRAIYGRYPCPAPDNVAPGSATYGFEFPDCFNNAPATGTCLGGICASTNITSGELIVIGSLPYKTLNLHDRYSHDSYKNRYTYAVTLPQTSNVNFDMSGGGIDVLDAQDLSLSLVTPKASAHFVIVSHGKNGIGSRTRSGVAHGNDCTNGSAAEQENCNANADFAGGSFDSNNFDDRMVYFSSVEPSEWQYSADDNTAIHLKNTDGFAIGFTSADEVELFSDASEISVKESGGNPSTGSVYASQAFQSEELCKEGSIAGGDCFEPELIGGILASNGLAGANERFEVGVEGGMSCYNAGAGEDYYMVGVSDARLLCTDEVFMLCPDNKFVLGVDTSGNVKCGDIPGRWCTDRPTEQTTCPDAAGNRDHILPDTRSGGDHRVYNGVCREFSTNYDATWWATEMAPLTTENEVRDLVRDVNREARVETDCDTPFTGRRTLVRDAYYCNDGTWSHISSHERRTLSNNFSSPGIWDTSGTWRAETSQNNSADPSNSGHYHDCWCREDYRYVTTGCPSYHTGVGIRIEKHRCPQTSEHRWDFVYQNNQMCACAPDERSVWDYCYRYYNALEGTSVGWSQLRGYIWRWYDITCDASGNPVQSPTPSRITGSCYCSPYNTTQRWSCSSQTAGTTNSWSWSSWGPFMGRNERNVRRLDFLQYTCPPGGINEPVSGLFIPHPRDPLVRTTYAGTIPACVCDVNRRQRIREDCPDGLSGTGMFYWQPWNCTLNGGLGGWETDRSLWTLDRDDCHKCRWKAPTGSPETMELPYGEEVNSICHCASDTANFCHTVVGPDENKVWTACECKQQSN